MKIPEESSVKEKSNFDYRTIASFEDACERLDLDPTNLPNLSALPRRFKKSIVAFYKLMIIFEAINNGWKPDFNDTKQPKYFPFYAVHRLGTGFITWKDSSTINTSKCCFFLCCGYQGEARYIALQFRDLYKDYILFDLSQPAAAEPIKLYTPPRKVKFR